MHKYFIVTLRYVRLRWLITAKVPRHVRLKWRVSSSLAETPESAGMLKYFAQICLQIFTSSHQNYDVPRTSVRSDGRPTVEKASFIHFWPVVWQNLLIFYKNPAIFIYLSTFIIHFAANILNLSANVRKLSANIWTGWNSRFQHFGLSARLVISALVSRRIRLAAWYHMSVKAFYLITNDLSGSGRLLKNRSLSASTTA